MKRWRLNIIYLWHGISWNKKTGKYLHQDCVLGSWMIKMWYIISKVKLTHLPVIEDHWKHQLNSLAAFSEMVNGRTLVNKHYLKTSDFLKFREFRAISQNLIPAKFLVKTSSRKLILSRKKLNSQISKFLQTSDEEEGTKILFCIQT